MCTISLLSSAGKVVGSLVFIPLLSLAVLAGAASQALTYDSLRASLIDAMESAFAGDAAPAELEATRSEFLRRCGTSETITQAAEGFGNITISCSAIRAASSSDFPKVLAGAAFDSIYYRDHDCELVECITSGDPGKMLAIASQEARSFFATAAWMFLAGAVIGFIAIAASSRHLFSILKIVGIDLIVAGIPGILLFGASAALLRAFPLPAGLPGFASAFLSQLATYYMLMLPAGIAVAAAGFALARKAPAVKRS